jgi:transcriptional regulator with XRE-family HTH domain
MTVSRWERGKTEPPMAMLRQIAGVLGIEPSALITEDKAA